MNKKHIARSFGKASSTYESEAPVQKWTANYLSSYIDGLGINHPARCLEIGCGTGFLTQLMLAQYPKADWVITDLSDKMLQQCQALNGEGPSYYVMDGENPDVEGGFDLIVSSLAFQWFHDFEASCQKLVSLLNPNGRLVFTTLGQSTFQQWRDNLEKLDMPAGIHLYPALEKIQQLELTNCDYTFKNEIRTQYYETGLTFLRALKAIGAQAPQKGYRPLNGGEMRKVLKSLEASGDCSMTYEIIIGDIKKTGNS
ncbi:hypothetical protein MTBPR1_10130 [Candidatus Terasakiella magnetica]|uniref:Malonyl-[acyl-carrier protein] O-methyltransferase n=1 Tax=Candidatus Terasakiella magnetica TaxID=1867952 RepID=A0A1C3RC74_9PROT|nr:methyltransferase domain-containing protein [Candidatus Terasakiella magnetica]SCA54883.1 hypothetical protein MTBPR1_10130 [Candidatus Terasakiella magnetica]